MLITPKRFILLSLVKKKTGSGGNTFKRIKTSSLMIQAVSISLFLALKVREGKLGCLLVNVYILNDL